MLRMWITQSVTAHLSKSRRLTPTFIHSLMQTKTVYRVYICLISNLAIACCRMYRLDCVFSYNKVCMSAFVVLVDVIVHSFSQIACVYEQIHFVQIRVSLDLGMPGIRQDGYTLDGMPDTHRHSHLGAINNNQSNSWHYTGQCEETGEPRGSPIRFMMYSQMHCNPELI